MEPMIKVEHLSKVFNTSAGDVNALTDVSFEVEKGEIFGIIGLSGAGKSTLVRCLNLLERPSDGEVIVGGQKLLNLNAKELRLARRKIGMIFQHFNLLMQRNVLDNVCFPMEIAGIPKKEAKAKAMEYLKVVGLESKAKAYPAQLSGGQKQRVAIARVLASNPEVLLCDEATSALDPETTKSILSLIKEINIKYGLTVVVITHEMTVIQEICHKCIVLESGKLIEQNDVSELFSHPKTQAAKRLIFAASPQVSSMTGGRLIRIGFDAHEALEPIIGNLILEFRTPVNILQSELKTLNGVTRGQMIVQLPDDSEKAENMIKWLRNKKTISIQEVVDYVI